MSFPSLRISLLGGVQMEWNGTAVTNLASRKAEAALIYLICNPRPIPRETLAALLWPENEQSRALGNLSVVLTSLRQQLGDYLSSDRRVVVFNAAHDYWLDTREFETAVRQARTLSQKSVRLGRTAAAQLVKAAALYQGDFLAGFSIRNAPEFEAWALLEQEQLRRLALEVFSDLVTFYLERHQFSSGIHYGQKLLALDPLQEATHRQLMHLYVAANQRASALAQYEQCADLLANELGVEPYQETVALYEQIKAESVGDKEAGEPGEAEQGRKENPPPRQLAATASRPSPTHNLPVQSTRFIGRERELAAIGDWLADPNGRLLTLIGPGGVGKSRLAQQAAASYMADFADGVWFIPLAPLPDINNLITAVANALNFVFSGPTDPYQQLINHLRPHETCLILDNFEHLLNDTPLALLSDILNQAPEVRLLVTSQARLHLQAETLLEVKGLAYPRKNSDYSAPYAGATEQLNSGHYPAVQLFVERARRLRPDFDLTGQEAAVIELCRLVDGLPLALELAATWVRTLLLRDIVAEIEENSDFLAATLHDLPARHRSLRALFDASWGRLTPEQQAVYRRLSVFRGGFTRQAAQMVADASLSDLAGLVDKSFMGLDEDGRYHRHPLLIQYGAEKLAADPELDDLVQARRARYFGDFMKAQEAHLLGGQPEQALIPIQVEMENIRAAWRWAAARQDVLIINQMADAIMQAFDLLGLYQDAKDLALLAANALPAAPADPEATIALGRTVGMAGAFLFRQGDYKEAMSYSRRALQILEPVKPHIAYGHSLIYAGGAAFGLGDFDAVIDYWQAAATAYQAAGSIWGQGIALGNLGEVMSALGDFAAAQQYAKQALGLARQMKNSEMSANALLCLAGVAVHEGRYADAERFSAGALDLHRQVGHAAHAANALANLAQIAHQQGHHEVARRHLEESIAILRQVGNRLYIVNRLVELGQVLLALDDHAAAQEVLQEAFSDAVASQTPDVTWRALVYLSELNFRRGDLEEALLLAVVVNRQEATIPEIRQAAEALLPRIEENLTGEQVTAVYTKAEGLELSDLIMIVHAYY